MTRNAFPARRRDDRQPLDAVDTAVVPTAVDAAADTADGVAGDRSTEAARADRAARNASLVARVRALLAA